jgi:hypothetical protein
MRRVRGFESGIPHLIMAPALPQLLLYGSILMLCTSPCRPKAACSCRCQRCCSCCCHSGMLSVPVPGPLLPCFAAVPLPLPLPLVLPVLPLPLVLQAAVRVQLSDLRASRGSSRCRVTLSTAVGSQRLVCRAPRTNCSDRRRPMSLWEFGSFSSTLLQGQWQQCTGHGKPCRTRSSAA